MKTDFRRGWWGRDDGGEETKKKGFLRVGGHKRNFILIWRTTTTYQCWLMYKTFWIWRSNRRILQGSELNINYKKQRWEGRRRKKIGNLLLLNQKGIISLKISKGPVHERSFSRHSFNHVNHQHGHPRNAETHVNLTVQLWLQRCCAERHFTDALFVFFKRTSKDKLLHTGLSLPSRVEKARERPLTPSPPPPPPPHYTSCIHDSC